MARFYYGIASLVFLVLISCVSMRENSERYYYARGKMVFRRSIPSHVLSECGDRLSLDYPMFLQLEDLGKDGPVGKFYREPRVIMYKPGSPEVIVHEATHDLLAYQSKKCLQEVAAYYAERIVRLEDENDRLRLRRK